VNKKPYIKKQLHELLYQALETERGGIKIYETALSCAQNKDLKDEWEEYLEQTRTHEQVLLKVFEELGLNPEP
jgi:rubrerythrin